MTPTCLRPRQPTTARAVLSFIPERSWPKFYWLCPWKLVHLSQNKSPDGSRGLCPGSFPNGFHSYFHAARAATCWVHWSLVVPLLVITVRIKDLIMSVPGHHIWWGQADFPDTRTSSNAPRGWYGTHRGLWQCVIIALSLGPYLISVGYIHWHWIGGPNTYTYPLAPWHWTCSPGKMVHKLFPKLWSQPGRVMYALNPSTQETKTRVSLCLQSQPGLYKKFQASSSKGYIIKPCL